RQESSCRRYHSRAGKRNWRRRRRAALPGNSGRKESRRYRPGTRQGQIVNSIIVRKDFFNHERNEPMRKLLMGLISLTLLASCSNSVAFVLDGQVMNAGDLKKVLLYEGEKVIDSAFLNENDKFRFRRTALEAKPYTLVVANRPYMLVLQNGDKVEFKTDLTQSEDEYQIEGSEISLKLQKLSAIKA